MFDCVTTIARASRCLALTLPGLMAGCASYYSHYGVFPAANASGEPRQVRVSWQSAEYPQWLWFEDKATPISVVTQCSERRWRLTDASHTRNRGACGDGIRACGEAGMDRLDDRPAGSEAVCMEVVAGPDSRRVADLGGRIELQVFCHPGETERMVEGETENMDYLRASPVPYVIDVRKAPRGALAGRLPDLDDSVCEQ